MGFRYRKSIKLLPGVKLNLSKSGVSTSVGKRGGTLNFSRRGTRATVGIPGSGLSYSTTLRGKRRTRRSTSRASVDAARAKVQDKYGFTDAEMKRFERKVKRNPRKYQRMSEEKLIRKVRGRGTRYNNDDTTVGLKRRKNTLIVILIILVLLLIASFTKKIA
ncbi:MAG: DUF4236 domain-containing protein [Erysipelotrichaceae bacterium]|nr:DUF4236 domain-containing protein [Erysipelotrichaceae bacterium]MBQ6477744.1 DUF4236 domain-containing protein [Erysipelotrichaceae bacterium]